MPGRIPTLLSLLLWLAGAASAEVARLPSLALFESDPVRTLALSADARWLYAVNTPDARLEILEVGAAGLRHAASVPVGLEPVAVAAHPSGAVWVVNHLSDSVSIVDAAARPPRVVRTLHVGDEPRDVVFAGSRAERAFVTAAHRGAHSPDPRGAYDRDGQGRADVYVFDVAAAQDPARPPPPPAVLTLFGDKPRALAVSRDGSRVWASVFRSGNQTTSVARLFVCPGEEPCLRNGFRAPGGLPPPRSDADGVPGGVTALIVRFDPASGAWLDELGRDWSGAVRFDLPDLDVFEIDALADPPREVAAFPGVGTVLYAMAANPVSGALYVANTEARNEVRFEGPGLRAGVAKPPGEPASVRGRLHEARVTVIDGDAVRPRHLNPHIPYGVSPVPAGVKERSLATPVALAVSADGRTLYLAALGSNAIAAIDTAALEAGEAGPAHRAHIPLPGGGPTGLVVDETHGRLYATTRFDNAVVSIGLHERAIEQRIAFHDAEPPALRRGRRFLYDATLTSSNGEASCAACHVFGDTDDLAWDLGNPDASVTPNPNPPGEQEPFHPLKGPMSTQSLRGLAGHGPMHWRGDRTGGNAEPPGDPLDERAAFAAFQGAFEALLGRDEGPLTERQMADFTAFALRLEYPPNPIRRLDNALRPDEARGREVFFAGGAFGNETCADCHAIDRPRGLFGTNAQTRPGPLKVPHLRNAYQKVGMFGLPAAPLAIQGGNPRHRGPQIRGFGFFHDGSFDTVQRFLSLLTFMGFQAERANLEAFVMAFETRLAPIVGQQVTLTASNAEEVGSLLDLLLERAGATLPVPEDPHARECELVAHGVLAETERGFAQGADGLFRSDLRRAPPRTAAQLRRRVRAPGDVLTFTCMPPGSGWRAGVDRDEDGHLDGDERRAGSDPADPDERPRCRAAHARGRACEAQAERPRSRR